MFVALCLLQSALVCSASATVHLNLVSQYKRIHGKVIKIT